MSNEVIRMHGFIQELEMLGAWYMAKVVRKQLKELLNQEGV